MRVCTRGMRAQGGGQGSSREREERDLLLMCHRPIALQRRDVGYYPDTPLSLNHALMKGKPIRPDNAPRKTIPDPPSFK